MYQISNFGRVKSFNGRDKKIKILRPVLHMNGYLYVTLHKKEGDKLITKTPAIHRLVAENFIPNPENLPEVNHQYGVKFDCYFENLEWCTSQKNIEHSVETGLRKFGEERTDTKLTNEQVREIRRTYIKGSTEFGAPALAEKYGVCTNTIYNVLKGESYRNVK